MEREHKDLNDQIQKLSDVTLESKIRDRFSITEMTERDNKEENFQIRDGSNSRSQRNRKNVRETSISACSVDNLDEVDRLKNKCASYKNEVERLKQMQSRADNRSRSQTNRKNLGESSISATSADKGLDEMDRLKNKCTSYKNEVERLKKMHEDECKKLRIRIKTLESGIKRLDLLTKHSLKFTEDIHSQSLKAFETLINDTEMVFTKPVVPKQFEDLKIWLNEPNIKEFVKQRRIFTNTQAVIEGFSNYSIDDLQISYNNLLDSLKLKNGLDNNKKDIDLTEHQSLWYEEILNDMAKFTQILNEFTHTHDFSNLLHVCNHVGSDLIIKNNTEIINYHNTFDRLLEMNNMLMEGFDKSKMSDDDEKLNLLIEKNKELEEMIEKYNITQYQLKKLKKEYEDLNKKNDELAESQVNYELQIENYKISIDDMKSKNERSENIIYENKAEKEDQSDQSIRRSFQRSRSITPNNNDELNTSQTGQETEIKRQKEKCKSYQNEVEKINKIHEEESRKLRIRIKMLESGTKNQESISLYFFNCFTQMHNQSMQCLENLERSDKTQFLQSDIPKSFTRMKEWLVEPAIKEFCKQRKLFANTEQMIQDIEGVNFEELQRKYDHVLAFIKSKMDNAEKIMTNAEQIISKETNVITKFEQVYDITWLVNMMSSDSIKKLFGQFMEYYARSNGFHTILDISNFVLEILDKEENFKNDYQICISAITKLLENVRNNIKNLTDEQLSKQNKLESQQKNLKEELEKYGGVYSQKEEAENQVQSSQKKLDELKEKYNEIQNQIENLLGLVEGYSENEQTQQSIQSNLTIKKNQLETEKQQFDERNGRMQSEIDELMLTIDDLSIDSTKFKDLNKELLEQLGDLKNNKKHLEDINGIEGKKHKDLLRQKHEFELDLEELNKKYLLFKCKNSNATSDINKDESDISTLQNDISVIDEKLDLQKNMKEKIETDIQKVNYGKDNISNESMELSSMLTKLSNEQNFLQGKKHGEFNKWKSYIESIIEVSQELVGMFKHYIDDSNPEQTNQIKKDCISELDTIESLLHSKQLLEKIKNDERKDSLTYQGNERTYIIRINQLVKEVENLNDGIKDVEQRVGEQSKKVEEQNSIKATLQYEYNELVSKEGSLRLENENLSQMFKLLSDFIENLNSKFSKIETLQNFIEEFKIRFDENIKQCPDTLAAMQNALATLTKQLDYLLETIQTKALSLSEAQEHYKSYSEKIETATFLLQERTHILESNSYALDLVNKETTEAHYRLSKIQIQIRMVNEENNSIEMNLKSRTKAQKFVEDKILTKLRELDELTLLRQEDLITDFKLLLSETNLSQKHELLSILSTLQELSLQDISQAKGEKFIRMAKSSTPENADFPNGDDEKYSTDLIIYWNEMFCDFFKDEIIKKFDEKVDSELIDDLSEKFDEFKTKCNVNFVRWLNKLIFMQKEAFVGTNNGEEDDDLFKGINKQKWMSILRHLNNIISSSFKQSSFYLKYSGHLINYFENRSEKFTQMKRQGLDYSENLYVRHKELTNLVYEFEQERPNLENMCDFCDQVNVVGENEIIRQEEFLQSFIELIQSGKK